jgi:nitrogen fixation protein FixH
MKLTGKSVFWGFAAAFAVVFAANGALTYFALESWTGLDSPDYYEKGLTYNATLAAEHRQEALGWRVSVALERRSAREVRLTVAFHDGRGAPLDGLQVSARLVRPTTEGVDVSVTLAPAGAGRYEGVAKTPLDGQWDVRVLGKGAAGSYRITRRVIL